MIQNHSVHVRQYPGKVLLFGEYSVLRGSQALAIPVSEFTGNWSVREEGVDDFQERISPYMAWIESQLLSSSDFPRVALEHLRNDLKSDLQYTSQIPIGYGMGSSGAFAASIYDRYCEREVSDMSKVRNSLARLESYFHGTSSGMDPLVSLINQPILRLSSDHFQKMPPIVFPQNWTIQLIDSGFIRSTSEWVKVFHEKSADESYTRDIDRQLIPLVEHAIHFILQSAWEPALEHIQQISQFQLQFFRDMIPDQISTLWSGLSKHRLGYMKLCGAGGGGYFLLFGKKSDALDRALDGYNRVLIS